MILSQPPSNRTLVPPLCPPPQVSGREIVRTIKFEQRATLGKDLKTLLMPTKLPESEARKVGRGRVEG